MSDKKAKARRSRHFYALTGLALLLPSALTIWARAAAAERAGSPLALLYEAIPEGVPGIALVSVVALLLPLSSMFCGLCYRAHRGNFIVTAILVLAPPLFGVLVIFSSFS